MSSHTVSTGLHATLVTILTVAAVLTVAAAHPVEAAPTLAPAATAPIHPGVQTRSPSGQCTANFVFVQGLDVYLGSAAHCTGTGEATDTNGCTAGSLPLGTKITVDGAQYPATLVYNSWLVMQQAKERNANPCAYNDFALIRLDPRDHKRVNPSVPFFGGPACVGDSTYLSEDVYSYGNSGLRLGLSPLSPKVGTSLGTTGNGWSHRIYTVTPGVPGDSGSGVLDSEGCAVGALSTLAIAPLAGSNNATDVGSALAYMRQHQKAFAGVALATGTESFSGLF